MREETTWKIKQHTLAKHALLREYLAAWFPILAWGGQNRRVIFLDGFAGPGIYADGEPGSPLIALKTLIEHDRFSDLLETEFIFIFIEKIKERFSNLENEINIFWSQYKDGKPENIRLFLFNDEFVNVAEQIINHIHLDKQLAPTFAFVDPFGWLGVPMSVINRLLFSDKCEVLFSFMYGSIHRFISNEGLVDQFIELFGADKKVLSCIADLSGDKRKQYIHDLYIHQLKSQGGFKYVRSFELVDLNRGRTEYFLVFGTRSVKGLEKMKDVMWSLDPVAGVRFAGFTGGQRILFDLQPDMVPLQKALLEQFLGKIVTIEEIENFVITETDYKKSHYKGQLKHLESEGLIRCESARRKRGTYPALRISGGSGGLRGVGESTGSGVGSSIIGR